ncbi:MAG: maleylpyruvate isomerase N-terminal domain-containing protein [Gulosibacter sp.]|uniref:maleylpyruvate isomerase N-terminal domain-containing protein n=1 Tax=Gulosibacter sp. TaxID=2817531 RepID=UPI003F92BF7C
MPAQSILDTEVAFLAAGEAFVELVDRIPVTSFGDPGLGEWDLRGLTGHTCRSLLTVPIYLGRPSTEARCESAAEYFAAMRDRSDHTAIAQRGVETGQTLGSDPAVAVQKALGQARAALAEVRGTDPIIDTAAGGMRLHAYLPTRTFELVVHSSDLAVASGQPYTAPANALSQTLSIVTSLASIRGVGLDLVRQLTGRVPMQGLPSTLL